MSGVVAVTVVMIMMAMKMIPMAMAVAVAGAGKLIGVTQLGRLHTPKCFFSHVTEVWLCQPSHVFSHDSPLFHQHRTAHSYHLVSIYIYIYIYLFIRIYIYIFTSSNFQGCVFAPLGFGICYGVDPYICCILSFVQVTTSNCNCPCLYLSFCFIVPRGF